MKKPQKRKIFRFKMAWLRWLLIALVLLFGVNTEGSPTGSILCNDNHTVTITIMNVVDLDAFNESDWRINNKEECQPTFSNEAGTVTYTNLLVGNCSSTSQERDNEILYVFKIRVLPAGSEPIQAVDHMFDASCVYVNNGTVTANFTPLTQREDNVTGSAFFTFTLGIFQDADFSTPLVNPVALDQVLYFRALVVTSSTAHNLDLFILSCHSSKQNDPNSTDGKVVFIQNGCGNNAVSEDADDTLSYACVNDSKQENFTIKSFRYFQVAAEQPVYMHCEFKVCLADTANSDCECPTVGECNPNARKRRSLSEPVVYRVTKGPYYSAREEKETDGDDRFQETGTEDNEPFYLNLTIILAVSGVVISCIACLTMFLIMRKRQARFSISEKNKTFDNHVNS